MHITSIIAEYNPLHFGHQFHITKTKEITNADYMITVLSGDYVQRGLPALMDKHVRARMALEAGSDLVLELPVPYALSSGEGFAFGGVSILNALGCVDSLSFGTEDGHLKTLMPIAKALCDIKTFPQLSDMYEAAYSKAQKQGLTPPVARIKGLESSHPGLDISPLNGQSNNMLALEYCKALYELQSSIQPVTITRNGQDYLDHTLSQDKSFCSATAIRDTLRKVDISEFTSRFKGQVSDFTLDTLVQYAANRKLIFEDDFSSILHYKLLTSSKEELTSYWEVDPELVNRIYNSRSQFTSFHQFSNLLWTKDTTYARICRSLFHILLGLKEDAVDIHQPVPYARVLGFKKESARLLSVIKKSSEISLITKIADAKKLLSPESYRLLEQDIQSAHIYDSIVQAKSGQAPLHEAQKQIIIL